MSPQPPSPSGFSTVTGSTRRAAAESAVRSVRNRGDSSLMAAWITGFIAGQQSRREGTSAAATLHDPAAGSSQVDCNMADPTGSRLHDQRAVGKARAALHRVAGRLLQSHQAALGATWDLCLTGSVDNDTPPVEITVASFKGCFGILPRCDQLGAAECLSLRSSAVRSSARQCYPSGGASTWIVTADDALTLHNAFIRLAAFALYQDWPRGCEVVEVTALRQRLKVHLVTDSGCQCPEIVLDELRGVGRVTVAPVLDADDSSSFGTADVASMSPQRERVSPSMRAPAGPICEYRPLVGSAYSRAPRPRGGTRRARSHGRQSAREYGQPDPRGRSSSPHAAPTSPAFTVHRPYASGAPSPQGLCAGAVVRAPLAISDALGVLLKRNADGTWAVAHGNIRQEHVPGDRITVASNTDAEEYKGQLLGTAPQRRHQGPARPVASGCGASPSGPPLEKMRVEEVWALLSATAMTVVAAAAVSGGAAAAPHPGEECY
eukprot:TRINITY_DN29598_c0_g1_i3.p1 TRINITY_DN29598_c0_g1~~TRINITY_DN29598_c0_g1_i3.p1  ORF type:complete len:542 (+),score=6.52 TRINITY_DN29598_c0_g1_i3:156-1628(+)